jgi:hypothetical protein
MINLTGRREAHIRVTHTRRRFIGLRASGATLPQWCCPEALAGVKSEDAIARWGGYVLGEHDCAVGGSV